MSSPRGHSLPGSAVHLREKTIGLLISRRGDQQSLTIRLELSPKATAWPAGELPERSDDIGLSALLGISVELLSDEARSGPWNRRVCRRRRHHPGPTRANAPQSAGCRRRGGPGGGEDAGSTCPARQRGTEEWTQNRAPDHLGSTRRYAIRRRSLLRRCRPAAKEIKQGAARVSRSGNCRSSSGWRD